MSDRDSGDSPALARLARLLRDFHTTPAPADLNRGLAKLRARLSRGRRTSSASHTWAWRGALVTLCAGLAGLAISGLREGSAVTEQPVAVTRVEGGQVLQGGYLSESGGQGVRLFFDEGSQLALTPGSRGRLRVEAATRLMLEHGSASLQITPTPEPRWTVESGPFLVVVKGTDFTVGWDPTSELFELRLRRGRVVVSGPLLGDGFVVQPGQKLTVSLPKAETVIVEERPLPMTPPAVEPAPEAAGSSAPAASVISPQSEPGKALAAATASSARQWRSALATGQWDRILAEAERGGLELSLEAASSDDLLALADAARYRRRLDVAQSALLAQRRRFPSSPRAAEAIFLLGRVSELLTGGRTAALQRYDEYLVRAPNGTYAAEALGRKMTLVNEAGGSARTIAQEYVRRFPNGSYAGAARTLLSTSE